MIYNAQALVSRTESAFWAVKNLKAEYEAAAEHYRREESACFEGYRNFLAKGRTIAGKYAALVRASAAAISGEGGASSAGDRINNLALK
jgi:hypothetical protein